MSNIPSFNSVCGTVVESLAETILNREAVIVQLRQENARLQSEVEAGDTDERKVWQLQDEVRTLREDNAALRRVIERQNSRISAQWAKLSKCCNTPSDSDPQTGVQYGDLT
jgi:predicted RNase H-like nuclease (RuvC/YqgF family)